MDRLQRAKFRPLFVENAVRVALRDAVAWRIGGGSAPGPEAFAAAAVAAARLALDAADADSSERSRTLAAVGRAAGRFTSSALCRRLMKLPASRFLRLTRETHGADVIVRDAGRHLHAIALSVRDDPFETGRFATRVAQSTPLATADRLAPLTVHVFSLRSGARQMFVRDAPIARQQSSTDVRVA